MTEPRITSGSRERLHHLPALLWLALVWVMLWGTWTWGNLVNGLLVGLVVTMVLPLPAMAHGGRLRPFAVLRLAGRLAGDLVVSSAQVAWLALRPGPQPSKAVVAVELRTSSDLLITLIAQTLTLLPGSIVLEVSTSGQVLYAHVLRIEDQGDVERFRQQVYVLEDRLIRAVGSDEDIRALDTSPAPSGPTGPTGPTGTTGAKGAQS